MMYLIVRTELSEQHQLLERIGLDASVRSSRDILAFKFKLLKLPQECSNLFVTVGSAGWG